MKTERAFKTCRQSYYTVNTKELKVAKVRGTGNQTTADDPGQLGRGVSGLPRRLLEVEDGRVGVKQGSVGSPLAQVCKQLAVSLE